MREVRFHFISTANPGTINGEETHQAAAILANCLSRQGLKQNLEGNMVTVTTPTYSENQPGDVFVVTNEAALASPLLLEHLDRNSAAVVSSARPAQVLLHELGRYTAGLISVDADGIASDEGSSPIVALLGAAARMVSFIDPEMLGTAVWARYDRSFPYAAQAATRTLDLGYMQAQSAM